MIEDNFAFDEDIDEDREIRRKKLAYKEEVAKAVQFLEDTKSKYYDEIKLRPGVTQDQQKASDFFQPIQRGSRKSDQQHEEFKSKTNNYLMKNSKVSILS